MRKTLAIAIILFSGTLLQAQDWVKKMEAPNANFYEVQQSFNKYWKKHERKEKIKSFFNFSKRDESESEGLMLYKRWEYTVAPRVFPSGKLSLLREGGKELEKVVSNPSYRSAMQANGNWQPLGSFDVPTNGGGAGRLNMVRFHPTQANTIFVGAPVGGLWKSTDAGATWTVNTDLLPSLAVSDLAIDPTNPNVMYLASGDMDAEDAPGVGLLKSTNGGLSWQITGLNFLVSQGRYVSRIIIHPNNSNILWAAASNGVYKSFDAGITWTKVITGNNLRDLELKPGTSNVLYATSNTNFYRSTDSGNSFTVISAGLPVSSSSSRMSIAVTPANPEIVYLVSSNASDNGFKGLYRSTNSGTSFSLMSSAPNLLGWDSFGGDTGGQGWYTLSIAVSPINANIVSVGGVNIWTSFDGGENWAITAHWYGDNGTPYVHADIHDLVYSPHNNLLYAGTDGGIFKANNAISNWTDLSNGLQIGQMYRLGCSASNSSLVLQGWQDNGTNQYNAGQWSRILGGDGMECFVDWSNPDIQYAESQYGNIARSDDGGNNFQGITNNINENGEWVTPWAQHPTSAATIFAGYENVWKSTNRGDSWTKISNLNIGGLTILEVSKSNPANIYISNGSAIFKTANGGTNWNSVVVPTAGSNAITDIAISNTDPNKIWMTRSGYTANNKVYKSVDGGATWQNLSNGLPNIPCNTVVSQAGTNDAIYVGTDFGVYFYDEIIQTWIPFMNGLPNVRVDELEIHTSSNKLRAATYGRGLWESSIYDPNSLKPFANFTADVLSGCPGFTVQFADQSFGNPTSWQWSFPGGIPASSTDQNPVVTYNNAATYNHVTLRVQNAFGTDSVIKLNYIAVSPFIKPTITLNNNDTLCEGETVQLKCSNAQAYLWYPNSYGNISFSTDTSGAYAVRTTDVFGCQTFSDTVNIVVTPVQPVTISMSNDTLFASSSLGLQWYLNGSAIVGATDTFWVAAQPGTYSVISTQANGCTSTSNNLVTNLTEVSSNYQPLEVYPNPGNGNFIFNYAAEGIFTVEVYDIEGKLLLTKTFAQKDASNNVYRLNIDYLAAGNYLMKVTEKQKTVSKKLSVIKH